MQDLVGNDTNSGKYIFGFYTYTVTNITRQHTYYDVCYLLPFNWSVCWYETIINTPTGYWLIIKYDIKLVLLKQNVPVNVVKRYNSFRI